MANYGKKNHRRAFDGNFNDYDDEDWDNDIVDTDTNERANETIRAQIDQAKITLGGFLQSPEYNNKLKEAFFRKAQSFFRDRLYSKNDSPAERFKQWFYPNFAKITDDPDAIKPLFTGIDSSFWQIWKRVKQEDTDSYMERVDKLVNEFGNHANEYWASNDFLNWFIPDFWNKHKEDIKEKVRSQINYWLIKYLDKEVQKVMNEEGENIVADQTVPVELPVSYRFGSIFSNSDMMIKFKLSFKLSLKILGTLDIDDAETILKTIIIS